MSTRPATTSHRARSRSRHPRRSRRARAGLWTLPVLWKTRAIPSASTDAVQKERFPQHLGRRRRRPQAPQATLSLALDHDITSRISKIRCDNHGRELTEQRRYAPMSIPLRRNPCSRSPELRSPA